MARTIISFALYFSAIWKIFGKVNCRVNYLKFMCLKLACFLYIHDSLIKRHNDKRHMNPKLYEMYITNEYQ